MRWLDALLAWLPRPLDPLRSIKAKLGILVAVNAVLIGTFEYYGLVILGWRPRYGLLAAVPMTLIVTQLLAHGMTSPLRQMTRAARDLAAGRPAHDVDNTSRDEVGELARAFTAMSRELASADAQRRELLGNVSHELRTPVTALRAQVENLVDGVRERDDAALGQLLDQVENLGRLLDDLLDLARAEGGAVPLRRVPVPVAALLRDVVRQVENARPGRAIEVRVTPPDLVVDADPHRLSQVMTNLLDNAARHGGHVQVAASSGSGSGGSGSADGSGGMVLEVTDDGPGIPPERWETVFERFRGGTGEISVQPPQPGVLRDRRPVDSRPPDSRLRDGGTGLGLAIARWAVALHGGRIAVVPAGPEWATGTRIRVELPAISTESPDLGHWVPTAPT